MTELAIVGGGSWGTALGLALASRFARVRLWVHNAALAAAMAKERENGVYLPGVPLPEALFVTSDLAVAVRGAPLVVMVTPSRHTREVMRQAAGFIDRSAVVVSATKGLEAGSLLRMSQVLEQERPGGRVAVLSGPTFAREVARQEPAALVVSAAEAAIAAQVQAAFATPCFRLYTNTDPVGVEVGAALKNVIAVAAGVVQGLGLGSNTVAALVTRGLAEISRLAVAMGGRPATLAGLAGLGDLVLTCTGDLSRNRRVGIELAQGRSIEEITASTRMVAEGVHTIHAAVDLAGRHGVEMPITHQMHAVLTRGRFPRDAIRELMERELKGE